MKIHSEEEVQENIRAPFPGEHQAFLLLSLSGTASDKVWLRSVIGKRRIEFIGFGRP